jgi:colanic acid biosynthesis glycosyl transferase WcaI
MKILVWGINYAPEVSGIAPFNTALCELTTFPYYPMWKRRPEDSGKLTETEVINGVTVARVWHYVPKKLSSLKRIIHEATFLVLSFLKVLQMEKFDVAVVVSPPLGLGFFAWLFSKFKGTPFLFHVQDLQPDAAMSLGMLEPSTFTRVLYKLEAFSYAKAARVSGICRGMLNAYERKGVPSDKIVYFPNGVAIPPANFFPAPGAFRARHKIGPEICLATYSGNLGAKQGLDILIEVAEKLSGEPVKILICGDGARRVAMEQEVADRRLKNLLLLPLQDEMAYREMMVDSSIALITQIKGTGQFFFPSKLLSAMVFRKPVLAVGDEDSELSHAVKESACGRVVAPGDVDGLATALKEMRSPEKQQAMGQNGKKWVAQFAFDVVHAHFEEQLKKLVDSRE